MKKLIGGAFAASILSTLCCAPALLFVVFGISMSSLSFLSSLEFMRIPMAILSGACITYAFYSKIKTQQSCECQKIDILKICTIFAALFFAVALFLFYPEILPIFMDDK